MAKKTLEKNKGLIPQHSDIQDSTQAAFEPYEVKVLKFQEQLTLESLLPNAMVIKKLQDVSIKDDIASFFKTWNILEYKNPDDSFSIEDFYKVLAYAHLYVATVKGAKWSEGTITIIRTGELQTVLKELEDSGDKIQQHQNADGEVWAYELMNYGIPIRIIQSEHLAESKYLLLRYLRRDLDVATLSKVLEEGEARWNLHSQKAYLETLFEANKEQFKELAATTNSPVIKRVLEESGLADKIRQQTGKKDS
jgi:hypothetical protein